MNDAALPTYQALQVFGVAGSLESDYRYRAVDDAKLVGRFVHDPQFDSVHKYV
jgi:hypothetical protein